MYHYSTHCLGVTFPLQYPGFGGEGIYVQRV